MCYVTDINIGVHLLQWIALHSLYTYDLISCSVAVTVIAAHTIRIRIHVVETQF